MSKSTSEPISLVNRNVKMSPSMCRIVEIWKIGKKFVFQLVGDSHNSDNTFSVYIWSPSDFKWNLITHRENLDGIEYISYYSSTIKDENGNYVPAPQFLNNMEILKKFMITFAETIKSC